MNSTSYKSQDFTFQGKQNRSVCVDKPIGIGFNSFAQAIGILTRPKSRDPHICGWQGEVLGRIDSNKASRTKKGYLSHCKRRVEKDDYHRHLYKLKKQAEFLESDQEEKVDDGKRKTRFPTQSDITELISKQTKYFPTKNSCEDIKQQKQQISIKQRQLLINNSVYLCDHTKRNYLRPSGFLKNRNRPLTSNPGIEAESLLITSLKCQTITENPNFQPIHTATRLRSRHRRKVRSVTDSFDAVCESAAGLVGNVANLKPKTVNNFVGQPMQSSGLLMFRKYNQIVKGKKLRTHRVSTVAG